jgi:hypothetical protein
MPAPFRSRQFFECIDEFIDINFYKLFHRVTLFAPCFSIAAAMQSKRSRRSAAVSARALTWVVYNLLIPLFKSL